MPAADVAPAKEESQGLCCMCCGRFRSEDDIGPDRGVLLDRPIEVKELFPLISQDMKISLSLALEDTLCPAFMRPDFNAFPVGSGWEEPEFDPHYYSNGPTTYAERDHVFPQPPQMSAAVAERKQNTIRRKPGGNKKFTREEDEKLKELVKLYGEGSWSRIAEKMEGRNRKQVRDRYENFLKKERSTQEFSPEEDALIMRLVEEKGRKWNLIAEQLPGRPPIIVKNRYYTKLRRAPSTPSCQSESPPAERNPSTIPKKKTPTKGGTETGVTSSNNGTGELSGQPDAKSTLERNRSQPNLQFSPKDKDKPTVQTLRSQHSQLRVALDILTNKISKLRLHNCDSDRLSKS